MRVKGTRFHLLVACVFALLSVPAHLVGQQATVRGKVVNEQEEPIAGATVLVQETDIQTETDARGEFSLVVPNPTATLIVNRPGFSAGMVQLNGQSNIVVRLRAGMVTQLDELVVVGYGTQKKSDLTGSVAMVDTKRLDNTAATTIEQAIQGAVAGVSITTTGGGAEPRNTLQIRGQNSILAGNEPLVVVDGIPYSGSISEINQNDIASISVLKDASAAAIYGARGSNGVLLITTKKGGGKARFSYEGYVGAQEITNLPRLMTGAEFADFKCVRLNGSEDCESVLSATELENLQGGRAVNWLDLATRTGFQQQHNLSFSGGSEGTRYYVAGSMLDVSGVARNDDFQRYNFRVNLDQEIKPWLKMGTNTQMSLADRSGMGADFEGAFFMNPLTNAYEPDGALTITPWPEDVFFGNPLQGLLVVNSDVTRRIFTSNFIEADLFEGLSYRLNAGLESAVGEVGRYYGRNTLTGLNAQGRASTRHATRFDWTAENLLNYKRSLAAHSVDFTGLFSIQANNLDIQELDSEGFPNDVLTYYQADVGALLRPSYSVTDSRLVSQMARMNYAYDDRYLVTLTGRRDGYSGFGANNKYGIFPSLALGWNVSNESFWPGGETVNLFKLRASYGQNGNQAVSPYRTLARLRDASYLDDGRTAAGFIPSTLGNPNLKWETTTALNLGADFGLWEDRVTGSVDVYRSRTEDLLLDRLISPVHGIRVITDNIGEVANRGVEFQVSTLNVERDDFSWSTDFNIAANRNELVDLYGNGQDDVGSGWFIGQPIDVIYDYKFDGIWQLGDDIANSAQPTAEPGDVRIRDVNGDGKIDVEDRTFLGSLYPDFTAGLLNTLRFRNLTFSASLYTVQGIVRENGLLGLNVVQSGVRRNTVFQNYWTPENPSKTVPRNSDNSNALGVPFLEDASYARLQDVTLSYDLPSSLTDRVGMGSMRLYVNGRNLWTSSDWTGLDPAFTSAAQRGIPLERVIIGGINVQF